MLKTIKQLKFIFVSIFILFMFQACEKETMIMTTDKEYPGVDPELWIYFQRFEIASAKRNVHIDLIKHKITATVEVIDIENVVGMCNHNPNTPHQIIIDEIFWMRASTLKKELIIFHELGHCYLKLKHRDYTYNDGRCKSIMRSGLGGCVDVYTQNTRKEYLDELFQ